MDSWLIYLKCYECSGYFTGIIMTSYDKEVGVHPYRQRAHKFTDFKTALNTAKQLKNAFKCIISYEVIKA